MYHTDMGLLMVGEACGGGQSMWKLSVLLIQFCCEPTCVYLWEGCTKIEMVKIIKTVFQIL